MAEKEKQVTSKDKVGKFIDTLSKGDNAKAGEDFKDALRSKVASSLDAKRVDIAKSIFNGAEAQPHSDPKPNVVDPSPKTDTMVDTTGNEVPSAESQPAT